jgi:hypothetical protein
VKKRTGRMAQAADQDLEFKPQYHPQKSKSEFFTNIILVKESMNTKVKQRNKLK